MSAFDVTCATVEEPAKVVFQRYVESRFPNYVFTHKGRLAKQLQCTVGDALANTRTGDIIGLEFKAERKHTGNLFLETWSNCSREKPGWLYTLDTDWLFYLFLDTRIMYVLDFRALKEWAYPLERQELIANNPYLAYSEESERFASFRHVEQRAYQQLNDTWGRIVPITELDKDIGVAAIDMTRYWNAAQKSA